MEYSPEIAILPFKVLELAELIVEKKKISLSDALFYLYNSNLYHNLLNPKSKLWYNSGPQLYDMLEDEKRFSKKMPIYTPETRFFIFCVEQYRLQKQIASATVLDTFMEYGVNKFLFDNFEVLHSQSTEYILREIDIFIKKRR